MDGIVVYPRRVAKSSPGGGEPTRADVVIRSRSGDSLWLRYSVGPVGIKAGRAKRRVSLHLGVRHRCGELGMDASGVWVPACAGVKEHSADLLGIPVSTGTQRAG